MKHTLTTLLCLLAALAQARLPVAVDGQALPSLAPILEQVTPAVVNISTRSVQYVRSRNADFYNWFYGLPSAPRERVTQSLGSGVIVDAENGYILTNHHVVDGADDISVSLADGRVFQATLIGSDDGTDVAVIQIDAPDLVALPLADSDRLRVGDFVVAVGNPFGLGQTVTSGIVSALGRTSVTGLGYQNFIQTDASINPGNSGGALIDLNGALVGINTAIFSPSGGNVGIGFAIPSSMAQRIMQQLLQFGVVRRGSLGLSVQDLTDELARAFSVGPRGGVVVTAVEPGSPAARAGLQAGDILLGIDGVAVRESKAFENREGLLELNKKFDIEYLRAEQTHVVSGIITEADRNELQGEELHRALDGAVLINLPAKYRRNFSGVLISEVKRGSQAWDLGLRAGDLITAVDKQAVNGLKALRAELPERRGEPVLNIYRNGRNYLLMLER